MVVFLCFDFFSSFAYLVIILGEEKHCELIKASLGKGVDQKKNSPTSYFGESVNATTFRESNLSGFIKI